MTLTVRSATVTGATTKGSPLTHAELDENFNHLSQAANISVTQSGSGAVATSVSERLQHSKHLLDFLPLTRRSEVIAGTNTTDLSTYVQAALDTGFDLDLLGFNYLANGLTQSTDGQAIVSTRGTGRLIKNANGVLLTCSGDDIICDRVVLRGESASYTGNNWEISGERPQLINCGSRDAAGRGLKATGQRVMIRGSGEIWQTAGTTSSDWDIEIGVSGTGTFYHHLEDIYTSQSDGGILLIDTGSHTILGGQFGKLHIDAGTGPAGVNGGKTIGARILGNVTVDVSNSVFTANQFGAVTITLANGTSGHRFDPSNIYDNGYTMTNNSTSIMVFDSFDGYAEGTWTPVIQGDSSAGTGTYNHQVGTYVRIGKMVFIQCRVSWSAHDGTGNILIAGLPYNAHATANGGTSLTIIGNSLTFSNTLAAIKGEGNASIRVQTFATDAGLSNLAMDTSAEVILSGHYFAA